MTLQHIGTWEYARVSFDHSLKDFPEKLSDYLLSPMRTLFGAAYKMEDGNRFTIQPPSISKKVASTAILIFQAVILNVLLVNTITTLAVFSFIPLIGIAASYISPSRGELYRNYRAFWVSQRNQLLIPEPELESVKLLCSQSLNNLPRARGGKTPVYLPQKHPQVVLKFSGYSDKEECDKRAVQMIRLKELLGGLGCQHLTIPECHVEGQYQIETRVPINTCDYHNMRLYIENQRAFDGAITDLVTLYTKYIFSDLICQQATHGLSNFEGGDGNLIRYDNLPLYMENGVGKIGLIDIEHISGNYKPFLLDCFLFLLEKTHRNLKGVRFTTPIEDLVRIFPYHRDLICAEARKNLLFYSPSAVEQAQKHGEMSLEKGYIEFRDWLKDAGKLNTHSSTFDVTNDQLNNIIEKLKIEIIQLDAGNHPEQNKLSSNFLQNDKDAAAGQLAEECVTTFKGSIVQAILEVRLPLDASEDEIIKARSIHRQLKYANPEKYCDKYEFLRDAVSRLFVEIGALHTCIYLRSSGSYRATWIRF